MEKLMWDFKPSPLGKPAYAAAPAVIISYGGRGGLRGHILGARGQSGLKCPQLDREFTGGVREAYFRGISSAG